MIEIFIGTLPLFAASYLSCLLSASMLALSGFILVGKKQEFLGATMSQASMLGIGIVVVFDWINAKEGLRKILIGFFKKIVIADSLAPMVDFTFNNYHDLSL